jgi:hypothetical protein
MKTRFIALSFISLLASSFAFAQGEWTTKTRCSVHDPHQTATMEIRVNPIHRFQARATQEGPGFYFDSGWIDVGRSETGSGHMYLNSSKEFMADVALSFDIDDATGQHYSVVNASFEDTATGMHGLLRNVRCE